MLHIENIDNHLIYLKVENSHKSMDGKMRDFCYGENFRPGNHPLFSSDEKAIQIVLYYMYDDFEVANPLGSKATLHKIGLFLFFYPFPISNCA